jgi:hypothetical protein
LETTNCPYYPLAQFHTKFLGVKGMDGVEPEDQNNTEIDDSTAQDDDTNTLDIDIPGVEDKVWVRADYIRRFKFAEEFYVQAALAQIPSFLQCIYTML